MHSLGALITGGIASLRQLADTARGIVAFGGGLIVFGALKAFVGIRLDAEDECNGTDLTSHKISASAERETLWWVVVTSRRKSVTGNRAEIAKEIRD